MSSCPVDLRGRKLFYLRTDDYDLPAVYERIVNVYLVYDTIKELIILFCKEKMKTRYFLLRIYNFTCGSFCYNNDTVAERLRRSTRNRLGFSRVGSSPAGVDDFAHFMSFFILIILFVCRCR